MLVDSQLTWTTNMLLKFLFEQPDLFFSQLYVYQFNWINKLLLNIEKTTEKNVKYVFL